MQEHSMHGGAEGRPPDELLELAMNVTVRRAQVGLSQAALAAKAGLSRSAISDIERAASLDPNFRTLLRLANALGTDIGALFAHTPREADEEELARRAKAPDDEFVDARALHEAIAERDERYSNAGRPRVNVG